MGSTKCLIWPQHMSKIRPSEEAHVYYDTDSPAGPSYQVAKHSLENFQNYTEAERARLTTWLLDRRLQGEDAPLITRDVLEYVKAQPFTPVYKRASRLLQFLVQDISSHKVLLGHTVRYQYKDMFAWSESVHEGEVIYLLSYLEGKNWIEFPSQDARSAYCRVTVDGIEQTKRMVLANDPAQAFVAMWFSKTTKEIFDEGIEPGIAAAGFKAVRIDRTHDAQDRNLDDAIIAEIRRSRFIVVDLTHDGKGERGSVYYEAGFAYGIGKHRIFTCRRDLTKTLAFDVNHYPILEWEQDKPEALREPLTQRIKARIGEGPLLASLHYRKNETLDIEEQ